jgi:hypothetical protein
LAASGKGTQKTALIVPIPWPVLTQQSVWSRNSYRSARSKAACALFEAPE